MRKTRLCREAAIQCQSSTVLRPLFPGRYLLPSALTLCAHPHSSLLLRVVMVGDPQQLPATILSALAKEVAMERSLFERLQKQGCPVKMLSVQYRMHPEIRQVLPRGTLVMGLSMGSVGRFAVTRPMHYIAHKLELGRLFR